jgi:hypothetical protein
MRFPKTNVLDSCCREFAAENHFAARPDGRGDVRKARKNAEKYAFTAVKRRRERRRQVHGFDLEQVCKNKPPKS